MPPSPSHESLHFVAEALPVAQHVRPPCSIAHGEKHQVAVGEGRQVATTSLASSAWPVLQRWVEECHEAAREKATRHIQKCLRSQMVNKWAQAAAVIPPPLVSSSSDDERVRVFALAPMRDPMELRMHQRNLSSGSEEESTSSSEDDADDVQMWTRLLEQHAPLAHSWRHFSIAS